MSHTINLEDRELHTVLAALRLWECECLGPIDPALFTIASNDHEVVPLTNPEVDRLCERINCLESPCQTAERAVELPPPTEEESCNDLR